MSGGGIFSNLPFMGKKHEHKPKSAQDLANDLESTRRQLKEKTDKGESVDKVESRLKAFGFSQETFEKFQHRIVPTEFPSPHRRFRLMLEYPKFNIEQSYYWFLRYFNESWGFEKVLKVVDTYSASVASSQFGNMMSRLSAQQNLASQYMKGVSEMVKGLFQIVREVRVIDERLQYYYDSDNDPKGIKESSLSSEIVLKGLWIDQVEGGAKNPGSVYGLSQSIGFTILPDLFFRIQIKSRRTLEKEVEQLKFNDKVKEVLKRKLRQYYEWKWRTKKELQTRRNFEIKYLKQHYDTIKMYMSWVKPYLRNIRNLQMSEKNMNNPNLVNAFESQIIELETLFVRDDFGKEGKSGAYSAVVSMHIFFRVKPELSFHEYEYQNKGPIHTGMADITLRAYAWDKNKIEKYIKYRQEDDLDLLSDIDNSVSAAMEALGGELKSYLKEADPSLYFSEDGALKSDSHHGHHKKEIKIPDMLDPFFSVFRGFSDIFGGMVGTIGPNGKKIKKEKEKKPDAKSIFKKHRVEHHAEHISVEAAFEGWLRYKMGPGANLYWVDPDTS
jgi:hypothetical protein